MVQKKTYLNMGMIGGGPGSLIGPVHRIAARMDHSARMVCGAFSRSGEKNRTMQQELNLLPDRIYDNWEEMLRKEASRVDEEKMDFVVIVTPNNQHYAQARFALEKGFHVLCDKPVTTSLREAQELEKLARLSGLALGITFNYTGYPMIRQARHMTREGYLGKIRKVYVQYLQGWLSTAEELAGNKQAVWRTNPGLAGPGGCLGDIGTHAFNLAEFVCNSQIKRVSARLDTFVQGRKLDDDVMLMTEYDTGATGAMNISQVCTGEENNLSIAVYGEEGYLKWEQMHPNTLQYKPVNDALQILRAGMPLPVIHPEALQHSRLPAGHPEGFIEAFANIYRNFTGYIEALKYNQRLSNPDFPGIYDGLRSMAFIETVLHSARRNGTWSSMPAL